jgi:hypothetical protein
MRIYEVLLWNDGVDGSEPHLDLSSDPFNDDPTNLANAFTRRGLVKHFWNVGGSEDQPRGPAPPDVGTEVIPRGTLEPSAASWQAEPRETERSGGSASAGSVSVIREVSGD